MGATQSLLEEALTVRAPGLTEATDLDSSSEADDDIEQSTPEVRKRPASAISSGSKKKPRRAATSKPAGVPKPIREGCPSSCWRAGVCGKSGTPEPAQTPSENTLISAGDPLERFPTLRVCFDSVWTGPGVPDPLTLQQPDGLPSDMQISRRDGGEAGVSVDSTRSLVHHHELRG